MYNVQSFHALKRMQNHHNICIELTHMTCDCWFSLSLFPCFSSYYLPHSCGESFLQSGAEGLSVGQKQQTPSEGKINLSCCYVCSVVYCHSNDLLLLYCLMLFQFVLPVWKDVSTIYFSRWLTPCKKYEAIHCVYLRQFGVGSEL